MNARRRFKYLLVILIVSAMFGLFNFQTINDLFFENTDPNERVTRTLVWKTTAGEDRRAVFGILKGYYRRGAPNEDGSAIALDVMYPSKSFVPLVLDKPVSANKVYILIKPGGERTHGDIVKQLIDTHDPEERLRLKIDSQSATSYTMSPISPKFQKEKTLLYLDAVRGHWIAFRLKPTLMHAGEGIIKDQTATVYYHYAEGLVSSPNEMYQWVMEFVENLQIKQ